LQTETVEEPVEEDEAEEPAAEEEAETEAEEEDEDAVVEEDEEKDDKPKTKKVEKTTWDWVLVNDSKPIWLRRYVN
jgi:heat shock protein beta